MQRVIIQIEGVGAYRVRADRAAEEVSLAATDRSHDIYLVDGCGRTWAPLPSGEWIFWDGIPCNQTHSTAGKLLRTGGLPQCGR